MRTRRRTQRRGTWRWKPRPRPDTPATEVAADAEDRDEYTTGQLTWCLGEHGFRVPRHEHHIEQDGDTAA